MSDVRLRAPAHLVLCVTSFRAYPKFFRHRQGSRAALKGGTEPIVEFDVLIHSAFRSSSGTAIAWLLNSHLQQKLTRAICLRLSFAEIGYRTKRCRNRSCRSDKFDSTKQRDEFCCGSKVSFGRSVDFAAVAITTRVCSSIGCRHQVAWNSSQLMGWTGCSP